MPGQTEFPRKLAEVLFEYMEKAVDREQPVVRLKNPTELAAEFEKTGVTLDIPDDAKPVEDSDQLVDACRAVLHHSVNTQHPRFINQLYAHADPVSITADWLAVAANTNVHTYEASPVFILTEHACLNKFARIVGGNYAKGHDGLFVPGGSIGNLYGLQIARIRADPDCRRRGANGGPILTAFISREAHYSYNKSCVVLGIGLDNLIAVDCDAGGSMCPRALEQAVQQAVAEGKTPFFVGAVCGSTVIGAFDPLEELSAICKKYNMWLHADGCWGGAALMSEEWRHLMKGIELTDSLVVSAHKCLAVPTQCSFFLSQHKGILRQTNATGASYLFQPDKPYAEYDIGDLSIQCGRRNDAFRFWLAWKAVGDAGWAARVNNCAALALYMKLRVEASGGRFVMTFPIHFINVCFWYVPPQLRKPEGFDITTLNEEEKGLLHRIAPAIKKVLVDRGQLMIGFQPLLGLPNFFRAVFPGGAGMQQSDVDDILTLIGDAGDALSATL
jgi:glutamate/tyrosine decarboxylase-like PLP-dependent enzyme